MVKTANVSNLRCVSPTYVMQFLLKFILNACNACKFRLNRGVKSSVSHLNHPKEKLSLQYS